ncbi:MAG: M3 family peptidase, partial [Zetaproteobacteria bacterium]
MNTETNPLLADDELPRFGEITAAHLLPALEEVLRRLRRRLKQLEEEPHPDWQRIMVPLMEMDEALSRVWGPAGHLNAVCDSDELRDAYAEGVKRVTAWSSEIGQSRPLYRAVARVLEQADDEGLDRAQRQALEHAVRDFRLAGVALDDDARERVRAIRLRLSQCATDFEKHLLDATRAFALHIDDEEQLRGLPEPLREAAAARARDDGEEGWKITLDLPSYLPFMQYAETRALRERLYRAYVTRGSHGDCDNRPLIDEILRLRHELAGLLGFAHYADCSLARKMAESVEEVEQFLTDLAARARPVAEAEWEELQHFAREELDLPKLAAWDIPFASERLRRSRYRIDPQQLRPWFPQPRVLAGLFAIAERLYGITIREGEAPKWHEDVQFFDIFDKSGAPIAGFWLDPYARPHKRGGAWMDECRVRWRRPDGTLQRPIAYLVCNFDRPVGDRPALMTHEEVVTLFHEFGHGLHHMLTEVDVRPVSGINGVPWDVVELPSQFMEHFCWQREGLELISGHIDHGRPLPEELRARLLAARHFQSGLQTLRQIEFALFDLRLHAGFLPDGPDSVHALLEQVREEVAVIRPPRFNRFECSFSHIFAGGYAAGYYSYKWAELLAADAFDAF